MRFSRQTFVFISLRKSESELDRLGELSAAATGCYLQALRSAAQYAVEIEQRDLTAFRQHIDNISQAVRVARDADAFKAAQASFRGELRDYRDKAMENLGRLRDDLEAGAKALASFAASIVTSGEDHETQLRRELKRLDKVAEQSSVDEMRRGIRAATEAIAA